MTTTGIQIIIVAHGDLACSLKRVVELIAGPQDDVVCLEVAPGMDLGLLKARIAELIASGGPTLVLVDLFGGTPWNLAANVARYHESVRVVSGVNLPMLLETVLGREGAEISGLARLALDTGRQSVNIAGEVGQ